MQTKTLALILAIASTALAQTPNVQFRAAQQKETVEGDMNAAIKLYRQVADGKSTPPALAARALVRLGQCYERLGSTEAGKAYERVVTQFGKEEAAAEARQRLASLPPKGGGKSPEAELVTRKVVGNLPWIQNTLTRDGRYTLVKPGLGVDLLDFVTGSRIPVRGGAPLVSAGEFSRGPYVISPDGQQFAFFVAAPGRGEMRVAHIDGSGIRTLASLPGRLKIQPFDWSGDGHTILAAPFSPDATANEFLLVDANGRTARSIRVSGNIGGQARFSPDKQWILFEKVRSEETHEGRYDELWRGDLFMIRVDGSGERRLVQREEAVSFAGWSPDGGSVLFVSEHLGSDHLWAVPVKDGAATSTPVSVMKGFSPVRVVGMTPQGTLLYSIGSWGTQSVIARLDGPGGKLSSANPVKPQSKMLGLSPAGSPDGRYLAYQFSEVDRMTGPSPPSVVIVRDLASGKEREVGRFRFVRRRLNWTPDSKSLLLPVRTADGNNVLRLDIASGKSEPLIPAVLLDSQSVPSYPHISPDGKYLYYLQATPMGTAARLMCLDLAQAQARQLATVHQFYALSPSGNEFVAPVADEARGTTVLRVIGSNGETLRDLFTLNAPEALTSAEWSPDGRQVYFARMLSGNRTGLFRISAAGGNPVALGERGSTYPDIRIHPTGREMAFVDDDSQMEVWRLEGLPQALARALRASNDVGLVARKVLGDPRGTVSNTLTRDGRYTLATFGFGIETLDLVTGQRTPVRAGAPLSSAGEVWISTGNVISPEGSRIAFAISAPGRGELRVANIDGSGIRTLASINGKLKIQPLDWSADGRTVLALPLAMEPGPDEFLLVDADGQRIRPVRVTGLVGARARLSPDGQWIAFERARNEQGRYDRRGDLFIVRTDGSGERQLVRQASPVALAGWDPEGKSVLFASEQIGVDHLWAVPVKEGVAVAAPVSLMKGFSHSGVLGMTMRGALLYSTGTRVFQVLTAKLNGPDGALSAPQPINAPSHYMTVNPVWSPDGRFLCYQLEEPDRIDRATRPDSIVMVRDVSNGQEREIGRFPPISRRISWTADNKSLLLPTTTTAGRNVLRVDVGSGKSEALIPAALTDSRSFYAYPQMSPDGRYLYYMQAPVSGVGARLMRLDLAQQQARQLATVHQFYALSPDGSEFVAPVADRNTTVLRVLGPNGETRHDLITIAEPDLLTSFAWSPDGQQVFFSKTTRGNQSSFFRIPASGGTPVSLGVQTEAFRDLSVHPNGGELAFVGVASDLEIWRLEGLSQSLAHALTPRTQATQAKQ